MKINHNYISDDVEELRYPFIFRDSVADLAALSAVTLPLDGEIRNVISQSSNYQYWKSDSNWHNIGTAFSFSAMGNLLDEPTGFPNISDSQVSFVNGTRTFTIQPTSSQFTFYTKGIKYTKTGAENIVIPDTEGLHYIYYDMNGALQSTTTFVREIITQYAFVTVIYWNATDNEKIYMGEERHGFMPGTVHVLWHQTLGTRFITGLGLGNFSVDGSGDVDVDAQFSVSNGTIADEDLYHSITDGSPQDLSPIAQIPVYYKTGASGYWRKDTATNFAVKNFSGGNNRLAWNEFTGGAWQQTEVDNNDFMLMHIFATNDVSEPIIAIQGQDEYNNTNQARNGAEEEINNLITVGLPFVEFTPVGSIIFQTSNGYSNAVKARVRSTDTGDDYVDFRQVTRASVGANTSHNNLSDRDVANSHPASAIQPDTTNFDEILSAADDTVKKALDTLDDHIHTRSFVTFSDGDTSPSVSGETNFKCENTSPTLLADFDDGVEGQIINLLFRDNNTTIVNGANIALDNAQNFTGVINQIISFQLDHLGIWREVPYSEHFDVDTHLDEFTILYMKPRGKQNSPNFYDDSERHTLTANGNCLIDRATTRFGKAILSNDGGAGSYIEVTDNLNDFDFNTEQFVIEFDIRLNSVGGAGAGVIGNLDVSGSTGWGVVINPTRYVSFFANGVTIALQSSSDQLALATWYRVRISRWGTGTNEFKIEVGGNSTFTGTLGTITDNNVSCYIARAHDNATFGTLNGRIANLRIWKGVKLNENPVTPPITSHAFYEPAGRIQYHEDTFDHRDLKETGSTSALNYNLLLTDEFLSIDASGNHVQVNLPAVATCPKYVFYLKRIDASGNTVTIQANGAETIDGSNSKTLASQYASITILSDGSVWHII